MPLSHLLLALAVVFVWGTNFVVIGWGLAELPPFLLAALRFTLSGLPFALLVKRPPVAWRTLAAVGLLLGVGQFGLLFYALRSDISPGLASLVIQTQVFFTIALAVAWRGERLVPLQWLGLLLALGGMAVVAAHLGHDITRTGLVLVLVAALCWAGANQIVRSAGKVDALAFMVWASLFAAPPLFLLSVWLEGASALLPALQRASVGAWLVVLWQAVGNTLFGYVGWNWLLARHAAATVAPWALLVPVFGMGGAALVLGEALPVWKWVAAAGVVGGLGVNWLASRQDAADDPLKGRRMVERC